MSGSTLENKEVKLSRLLKHVWANSKIEEMLNENVAIGLGLEKGILNIYHGGKKAFYEALDILTSDENIAKKVSSKIIKNYIKDEIVKLHQLSKNKIFENSKKCSSQLIQNLLNYPVQDCEINIPVFGLELSPYWFNLEIGGVVIYSIFSGPSTTEAAKWTRKKPLDQLIQILNVGLENKDIPGGTHYWAKVTVRSNPEDHEYFYSEAVKLIREALALLALYIHAIPSGDWRKGEYLLHPPILDISEVKLDLYPRYVLVLDPAGKYDVYTSGGEEKVASIYEISEEYVNAFNKEGFKICCNILKSQNLCSLHRRIRKALEYFGMGIRSDNLLLTEREGGKNQKLQSRVKWLLGSTSKEREYLSSKIKYMYNLRSDIVHGELHTTIEVEAILPYLHWILYSIIKRLVTGSEEFSTVEDLVNWVREQNQRYN